MVPLSVLGIIVMRFPLPLYLTLGFIFPISSSFAAGIDYPWMSTSAMGTAHANAAEAVDASTVYFNPAGMTRMRSTVKSDSVQLLSIRGKFTDEGTTRANGEEAGGGPAGSYHPQVIGGAQSYIVMPYNGDITFGLGLFVPYGANINYKSEYAGRFFADRAAIETLNINPVMAIRFDEKHSAAIGFSGQVSHAKTKLGADVALAVQEQGLDAVKGLGGGTGGALCDLLGGLSIELCRPLVNAILPPEEEFGMNSFDFEGYGFGVGYNLGYMFSLNDNTRFSLAYRSRIRQTLRGDVDWRFDGINPETTIPNPNNITQQVNAKEFVENEVRPDSKARLKVTTPDSLIAGVFHQFNERLALMASVMFQRTSLMNELRVQIDDPKQGDAVIRTNFRDTFRVGIGANYRVNDKWLLRGGLGYDMTPVPNAESRHAAVPDADRYSIATGVNYRINDKFTLDFAYSFIMLADARSNYTDFCHPAGYETTDGQTSNEPGRRDFSQCTGNGGTFRGRFTDSYIHSVGAQINHTF